MDEILAGLKALQEKVSTVTPSRERSCLLTKLDEARHWAQDMQKAGAEQVVAPHGTTVVQN